MRGGTQPGEQLVTPAGILAMPDGGFMVADTNASRILRFNSTGRLQYLCTTAEPGAAKELAVAVGSGTAGSPCLPCTLMPPARCLPACTTLERPEDPPVL